MRGDFVIVRAYGGFPFIRRIWEENRSHILITNDEQLKHLLAGEPAIEPLAIPREDVFKYDAELVESIGKLLKSSEWDWNKLVSI